MTSDGKWVKTTLGKVCVIQQGKRVDHLAVGEGVAPVEGATGVIGSWTEGTYAFKVVGIGCRGSVGRSRLIPEGHWLGNNVMGLYPRDQTELLTQYLVLALSSINLDAAGAISGQVQKQITRTSLAPVPIEVPPLPVQRRIVDLVGAVDMHITDLDAEMEAIARKRTALLTALLTRRVAPSRSEDEAEWQVLALSALASFTSGKNAPRSVRADDGEFRLMGANGQIGWVTAPIHEGPAITVGRVGACGEVHRIPKEERCWISDNALIARGNEGVDLDFLALLLELVDYDSIRTGTTQPLITQTALKAIEVPAPPLPTQREIADIVAAADANHEALIVERDSLVTFRSQLLQSLLSREVEIPESYDELLAGVA